MVNNGVFFVGITTGIYHGDLPFDSQWVSGEIPYGYFMAIFTTEIQCVCVNVVVRGLGAAQNQ